MMNLDDLDDLPLPDLDDNISHLPLIAEEKVKKQVVKRRPLGVTRTKVPPKEIIYRACYEQFIPSRNRVLAFEPLYFHRKFLNSVVWMPVILSAMNGVTNFIMFPFGSAAPAITIATTVVAGFVNYNYYKHKTEYLFRGIEYEDEVDKKMLENFKDLKKMDFYVGLIGGANILATVYAFAFRRHLSHVNDPHSRDFHFRKIQAFKTWRFSHQMRYSVRRYVTPLGFAIPYVLVTQYLNGVENRALLEDILSFRYKKSTETIPD